MTGGGRRRHRGRKGKRAAHGRGGRFFADGRRKPGSSRRSHAEWKETQAQEDRDAQAEEAPAQESTQEEEQVGRRRRRAREPGASVEDQWADQVVEFLESTPERSYKVKDLVRALGIPRSRYRDFRAVVLATARAGRCATLPRRRFQALGHASVLEGLVTGIGQRATHVAIGDDVLPLSPYALDRVIPGDRVRVRRIRDRGEVLGQIQQVLAAAPRALFGELERIGKRWVLIPDRRVPGFAGGAFLRADVHLSDHADGMLARGVLPAYDPATTRPELSEVELLGPADHPRAAIARRVAREGWPHEFSAAALTQAAALREDPRPRRDFVGEAVFTIDPATAKDHDDAISIRPTEAGGWVLGVHIADVASYVPSDSPLDDEALERTTSVYPPGQVIPMLPEALSGGECSLHHGVARRVLSVELTYDATGARHDVALGRGLMRSVASLSYEQAQDLLDDVGTPPPEVLAGSVDQLIEPLRQMSQLATALRQRRRDQGSLFVDRPERTFTFDAEGHVDGVQLRHSLSTHWMIEEFMLEANRAVAEALHAARLPLLWRVHEDPDPRKVQALVDTLYDLGIPWRPTDPPTGHDYADLFAMVEGRPEASLISLLALRSLMKAQYRAGWDGHFGLAFSEYTHFTSPIRRYPDLHNQRWLHRLIDAVAPQTGWVESAPRAAASVTAKELVSPADRGSLPALADLCSDLERTAMQIERDAMDICSADYLKPREGEEVEGVIVSLVSSGLFVELDGLGIDGFVGVEQLPSDWYTLVPHRHAFVGERSGRAFGLGHRVRVLLEFVDVENGRIWLGTIRSLRPRRQR